MDTETMNTEIDASNAEARIEDVYFLTLQLAFDAAQNGDTVTLVRDVPLPTIASCEADLTLDLHGHQIFLNIPFPLPEMSKFATVKKAAPSSLTSLMAAR